jgi:hypothetical protein
MMKNIIYLATLTLALAALNPAAYATHLPDKGISPHVFGTGQFPQTKWGTIRQSFRLEIPSQSKNLSELDIEIPKGLTVRNDISVSDKFGRKVQANTSINRNKMMIAFPQAVSPGTILNIDMNRVNRTGTSNAWLYRISAKFVGSDAEMPIGIARFGLFY